ncbi:MAG: hypothetical protein CMP98_08675 [Gammaproteobacteria bacterium]|nr:hypothetical protein [Gammaproteobacteria bacterium]OUU09076.1 MAG: hypothetical protein CBB94_08900 [Gammaproteobacteria bacterium TMED34]
MKNVILSVLYLLLLSTQMLLASDRDGRTIVTQALMVAEADASTERQAALQYCQACHLFTEPSLLPQAVWRDTMLPRMGVRLGMHHLFPVYSDSVYFGDSDEEKQRLEAAGVFPSEPQVPEEDWRALVRYFLENAPTEFPPEDPQRRRIERGLRTFSTQPWSLNRQPLTTMVKIDETKRRVYFGDGGAMSLVTLSSSGAVTNELFTGSPPVDLAITSSELMVLAIGFQFPSDLPRGEMLRANFSLDGLRLYPQHVVLDQLKRPVNATWADLSGDGLQDILISEFGHRMGALTLYRAERSLAGVTYRPEILLPEPGAMSTYIRDMDQDGRKDVIVVMGQHREGVFILYNSVSGYKPSWVVQSPPTHGTAHVDVVDFDQDGALDLLVSNGDNGDYAPILKRHHGVRLYRNLGDGTFTEIFFYPLNGAFKALARDFDQDGDLDIAAIAMFADYEHHPEQGFVYLENISANGPPFTFKPRTLTDVSLGRWLTMDAGDLDSDGDLDIVLGSFAGLPHPRQKDWMTKGQPVLLLENTTR